MDLNIITVLSFGFYTVGAVGGFIWLVLRLYYGPCVHRKGRRWDRLAEPDKNFDPSKPAPRELDPDWWKI